MKRPLYYLLCAIACTSMVGATMPMAAIAEVIQPQATVEQQAQGADTNATADTAEDSTATSTGTSAVNTESADGTTTASTADAATPGTTSATTTPHPLQSEIGHR